MSYEFYAFGLLFLAVIALVFTAVEAYRTGYRRGQEKEQTKERMQRYFG